MEHESDGRRIARERSRTLIINADGACSFDGQASFGIVVREQGKSPLLRMRKVLPPGNTSNEAEWRAALAALDYLVVTQMLFARAELRMDSQLVVYQITGRYRVRADHLKPYAEHAAATMRRLRDIGRRVDVRWVRRERNESADRVADTPFGVA